MKKSLELNPFWKLFYLLIDSYRYYSRERSIYEFATKKSLTESVLYEGSESGISPYRSTGIKVVHII